MKRVIYLLMTVVLLVGMLPVQPAVGESCTLMNVVVTNTADDGEGSLRQAIADVCSGGEIKFDASLSGETITLTSGQLTIDKNMIIDASELGNRVTVSGNNVTGVFKILSGTVTLDSLIITNGQELEGGGIITGGNLTLKNSVVSNNVAIDDNESLRFGGGIYNYGDLTIVNSVIEENSALEGGGLYNDQFEGYDGTQYIGIITVIDSTIEGNQAERGGGIYNVSQLTLTGSTLVGNRAEGDNFDDYLGGGIYNFGTATVANSTFAQNHASSTGSGIYNLGTMTLYNSTLSGNTGSDTVRNYGSDAKLSIANTIIADVSEYSWGCSNDGGGKIEESKNNMMPIGNCGDFSTAPTMLGPLQDNGGLTKTMALLEGSYAIDAGDNGICFDELVGGVDQRGVPRPQGDDCDIGAYEYVETDPVLDLVVKTPGDDGDGKCDETCTLRDAVLTAESGDTITFAEGLSGETIELDFTLHLDKDLTIDGSMLDAKVTISGGNSNRVFYVSEDSSVTLDSLIIAEGLSGEGAGIYNDYGHLTVKNSVITTNEALYDGGGIYNYHGVLTIENSLLTNNIAGLNTDNISSSGGGVYNLGGVLNIVNSVIERNTAQYGGGLASTDDGDEDYGFLTVVDSTIANNSAIMGGGIDNQSFLTLSGSTLVGNTAEVYGGGINNGGEATVANSTFTGNGATDTGNLMGSAIHNAVTMTVYNSTFAGNTGSDTLVNHNGELSIANTIIVPEEGYFGCKLNEYNPGSIHEYTNNLIASGNCGATSDDDPKLGHLKDNGGPTMTMALLDNSPAIDAGDNDICFGDLVDGVDQRGVTRPQGDRCDIGAYEYIETYALVVNTLGDAGDGDCDATCSLRDAVESAESGDTITFAESLWGETITLTRGHIHIGKSLTIEGPGAHLLAISGGENEPNYDDYNASIGGVFKVYGFYGVGGVEEIEVNISGLTIRDGRAREGGAVYNHSRSTLIMTDCVIGPNNVVTQSGGGLSNRYGNVTLNRCTVEGNHGTGSIGGAGISGADGVITLINTTVSGNVTNNHGGGIFVGYDSTLNLIHTTITKNIANQDYEEYPWGGAGGIYIEGGTVNIHNSIVAGNTDLTGLVESTDPYYHQAWPDVFGSFTSQGGNLIGDGTGSTGWGEDDLVGTAAESIDAKLGSLAINEPGTTPTHALVLDSPAIDAVMCLEDVTIDQRGVPRPQPKGGACDIGSFELESTVSYGELKISKVFDPLTSEFTDTFAINYVCDDGVHSGTVNLAAGASQTISDIPTGTQCTVTETSLPEAPTGWSFGTPSFYPEDPVNPEAGIVIVSEKSPAFAEVTVTNMISRDTGTLMISKDFEPGDSGFEDKFSIHYNCGAAHTGTVELGAGEFTTISGIPTGTSCTVTEPSLPAAPTGWSFGTPSFNPEGGIVTVSEKSPAYAEVIVTNTISPELTNEFSQITTARTKCDVYASGEAPELLKLFYSLRFNKQADSWSIHKVTPATFLYYVTAILPAEPSTLVIEQSPDAGFPDLNVSVTLFDENCAKLSPQAAKVSIVDGNITVDFTAGIEGRTVYVAVTYSARTLRGQIVDGPPYPDIDYLFSALLNETKFTDAAIYLTNRAE